MHLVCVVCVVYSSQHTHHATFTVLVQEWRNSSARFPQLMDTTEWGHNSVLFMQHTHTPPLTCTCIHAYAHAHVYIYTSMHMNTCMHTCTYSSHICTLSRVAIEGTVWIGCLGNSTSSRLSPLVEFPILSSSSSVHAFLALHNVALLMCVSKGECVVGNGMEEWREEEGGRQLVCYSLMSAASPLPTVVDDACTGAVLSLKR